MKTFAKIIRLVLIAACLCFSLFSSITGANEGADCSVGGIITRQTEEFILSTFSYTKSPQELADALIDFALDNFLYDKRYLHKPQTADTARFVFQIDFHGVCMDFSAFAKSVFQVICRYHGWENVGCYVLQDWNDQEQDGHAVNYNLFFDPARLTSACLWLTLPLCPYLTNPSLAITP